MAGAAPRPSRASPGRYRILIATGARSRAQARRRLVATRVPAGFVLAQGYPRLVASASVPGLHPGFHVFVDHQLLLARLRKALPGTYARTVRTGDQSCPLFRGPRPDAGTPARRAWQRLATHRGDVAALPALGAWHEHTLGSFSAADYFYSRALARDPASAAAQQALARLQFLGLRPNATPDPEADRKPAPPARPAPRVVP